MSNTRTQWFCCLTQPPERIGEYELKRKLDADMECNIIRYRWCGMFFNSLFKIRFVLAVYSKRDYCWRGLAEKPKGK